MPDKRRYGWRPDKPDHRDRYMLMAPEACANLPAVVDLRAQCPPIYDQGQLGSCTANAIAAAMEFDQQKQGSPSFMPSRLFVYYNERVIEDTVSSDGGAEIRDGIKSVNAQGVCPESTWPYDISQFATKPPDGCYSAALNSRAVQYQRVSQHANAMKACLAAGYPFVFGFSVYTAFESDAVKDSGVLNMPEPDETLVGGHAVLACGYQDDTSRFIVRNSWGTDWGTKGYFTMPYKYLAHGDLADDFWTIRLVQ